MFLSGNAAQVVFVADRIALWWRHVEYVLVGEVKKTQAEIEDEVESAGSNGNLRCWCYDYDRLGDEPLRTDTRMVVFTVHTIGSMQRMEKDNGRPKGDDGKGRDITHMHSGGSERHAHSRACTRKQGVRWTMREISDCRETETAKKQERRRQIILLALVPDRPVCLSIMGLKSFFIIQALPLSVFILSPCLQLFSLSLSFSF